MKKMIALLLALIMVFSLVACSGSADTAKDTTTTDSTTDSTTTDTTGSDTTAAPEAPRAASSMSAWPPSPTPSTRL